MKRVLVIMTKETGDDISVSVKINDGVFTKKDKDKLKNEVAKKLIPDISEALYFRIRYNEKVGKSKGITESVKVFTVEKLNSEIDKMFSKLGVVDE